MSDIPIYEYLSEIDDLLESDRLAEAAAHCRHILQQHPRHIETYRLLGKTLLEQQQYEDASDLFQRILSADPEDLVAHVGLSIIFSHDEMVPQAIWHLERAFEVEPYNSAIRQELRELYRRRDGQVPERISLTRGALARLYARGDLHDRAAAELRQMLNEDDSRVDLQVLLAEVLWRDGQRVEAVELCLEVLAALPNCVKANAIVAEVWLAGGQIAEAQPYLKRLLALVLPDQRHNDPDSPVGRAFSLAGAPELPRNRSISRLDYEQESELSEGFSLEDTPDWVYELDNKPAEPTENWLNELEDDGADRDEEVLERQTEAAEADDAEAGDERQDKGEVRLEEDQRPEDLFGETGSQENGVDPTAGTPSEAAEDVDFADDMINGVSEELPDWLSELDALSGVEPDTTDESDAAARSLAAAELPEWLGGDDEEIEAADLPPWLTEVDIPDSVAELTGWEEERPTSTSEGDEMNLGDEREIDPGQEVTERQKMGDERESDWGLEDFSDDDESMAWLEELAAQQGTDSSMNREEDESSSDDTAETVPDWFEAGVLGDEESADWLLADSDLPTADSLPDWLSDLAAEESESVPDSPRTPDDALPVEALPDWLVEMAPEEVQDEIPTAAVDDDVTGEDAELPEALPDWLADLAAEDEEAPANEVVEETDLGADVPAGWLSDLETDEHEAELEGLDEVDDSEAMPDWLKDLAAEEEDAPVVGDAAEDGVADETLPDWLRDLSGQDEAPEAEMSVDGAAESDWADDLPDWLSEPVDEAPTEAPVAADREYEEVEEDNAPAGELPDWVQELVTQGESGPEGDDTDEGQPDATLDEDISWLDQLAAGQGEVFEEPPTLTWEEKVMADNSVSEESEPVASSEDDEVWPDWLQELEAAAEVDADRAESALRDERDEESEPTEIVSQEFSAAVTETTEESESQDEMTLSFTDSEDAMSWLEELATQHDGAPDDGPTVDDEAIDAAGTGFEAVEEAPEPEEAAEAVMMEPMDEMDGAADGAEDPIGGQPAGQVEDRQTAPEAETMDEPLAAEGASVPGSTGDSDKGTTDEVTEPSDFDDLDAAMAWLEQLAARQGAPLEELPTLSGTGPLDEATVAEEAPAEETVSAADEVVTEPPDTLEPVETMAVEDVPDSEMQVADVGAEPDVAADAVSDEAEDTEDAMAWLEQLAARQAATSDEEVDSDAVVATEASEPEMTDAGVVSADELADEIPDDPDEAMAWLEQLAARQGAPVDELPSYNEDEPDSADVAERPDEQDHDELAEVVQAVLAEHGSELAGDELDDMPDDPDLAMAWLEQLAAEQEPGEMDVVEPEAVDEAEAAVAPVEDFDEPDAAQPETADAEPAAEQQDFELSTVEQGLSEQDVSDSMPDWLTLDLPSAFPDEEIDWLEEATTSDVAGWLHAEDEAVEATSEAAEAEPAPVMEAESSFTTTGDDNAPSVLAVDQGQLSEAREALAADDEARALTTYQAVLDSGEGLVALIAELEVVTGNHPNRPLLRRMLGDAYMRNGQLQKALDAYRHALDQL